MKNLILVMITGFLLVACSSSDMKSEENVKLVTNYVKAVENLDYNAMDDILDENYIGIGPSKSDSINKENAIKNWKQNVENLYEKITYSKNRNIAVSTPEGEWVSNWADLTITYKGSGKQVSILSNTIYQIENGKIVKSITFYNEADALEQLGYVFINPDDL
ncbi:ester cyclase [Lutimonas saemankumensis]|uniref:nuclear transport factor 2 family protein n=1 Tax=Lutimonas saemankumensis TaxID=483016 RepID=UPI001CD5F864|nr:ester cyclase [Lutimonas saemankumensis]MCA0931976.1 ester cyclase [Lutimonas saemankumensis]